MYWSKERLKHLLNERLNVFSNGTIHELVQICQGTLAGNDSIHSSYLVGQQTEEEMLNLAQGSPRRLLLGGQLLFEAHFSRTATSGLVELEDWHLARERLLQKMPPLLRIDPTSRVAYIGERQIALSGLLHKILMALANAKGICYRQQLVAEAWGVEDGVSDEAIDKNISRLRLLLQDNSDNPIHIKTIRDIGFQLMNYKIL